MTPFSLPTRIRFCDPQRFKNVLIDTINRTPCVLFLRETDADRLNLRPLIDKKAGQGLIWIRPESEILDRQSIARSIPSVKSGPRLEIIAIGDAFVMAYVKRVVMLTGNHRYLKKTAILNRPDPNILDPKVWIEDGSGPVLKEAHESLFDELVICDSMMDLSDRRVLTLLSLEGLSQSMIATWTPSTSPMVQRLAMKAIELIVKGLPMILVDPLDKASRAALIDGLLLSSMAHSNTKPSIYDALSRHLAFDEDHKGTLIKARILPDLLRHNLSALSNPEGLYEACDIDNPNALRLWIDTILKVHVPMTKNSISKSDETLMTLIEVLKKDPTWDQDPIPMNAETLLTLLKASLRL